jgi:tRNA pseudouridine synthase 8/2,5-diamino-6-(5-phospho-D-ribitylamino)-pyrimidin-4(3H)-one deaminase
MIAKDAKLVTEFHEANKDQYLKKTYLARVFGKFPDGETVVEKPIYCESHKECKYACCELEEAEAKGAKYAKTVFKRIWHEEKFNTSLIECKLITGKTHQIRVHLRYHGRAIVNSYLFGGNLPF